MLAEFHFLRPMWLLAYVPLFVFAIWFVRRRHEMARWKGIVDGPLMPHVLIGTGDQGRRRVTLLLVIAGILLTTALAGPVWQRLPQPLFRSQDALVIALDLSRSMDVADIKPSRLARARFKISDILQRRVEGQTALIAYAAEPFVISPLTDDTDTIAAQLPALTTDLMPAQGSRADRALEKAADLLRQSGSAGGQVLLITDGADAARAAAVARQLNAKSIRVSVLGIGTDAGGPIPGPGGFLKRPDGSIVVAKLDPEALREIAAAGGGQFRQMALDEGDIDELVTSVGANPADAEASGLEADVWREEGPWLLLPLLPLAAFAFRRGVLAVWVLAFILPARPAAAFDWADLWARPDQQAARLLEQGDAAAASELFVDPAWKGAAAYRTGLFEDSAAALEGIDDPEATYNRANALARLGRYDEAIANYEEVLEQRPNHQDARYNLELLRELQRQQQQDQQQQQQQGQQQQQQGQRQQQQQQGGGDSSESGQDESGGEQNGAEPQGGGEQDGRPQDSSGSSAAASERESAQPASSADDATADPAQAAQADQVENSGAVGESDSARDTPQSEGQQAQAMNELNPDGTERRAAEEPAGVASAESQALDEEAQATEQWLRKIPDDPAGLLRRKFYYQYQQRPGSKKQEDEPW